jgi:protein SCO1/2
MKKILILAILFVVCVFTAYFMTRNKKTPLPILNPIDLNSEMVDSSLKTKGIGHKIGKFSFLNQNNEIISDKDVRGKVFVAEYFFTTCGTICPIMNQQMSRVHKTFQNNSNFKILSFTVNPEIDTVEQLHRYAKIHGANSKQWYFLTGQKKELYKLARTSFFVLKPAEAQNLGDAGSDFIHTNNFVLIDQKMQIRGYYDGTSSHEVNILINDIQQLIGQGTN